ncbi:glycosyltransferase family 2 protein [Acinetobacter ursingii]|uniref:glycosyltransferase family 2 protein n=1 Tax=Acinetobacter ursingii TaxID=108980 RepID=UPI003AF9910B
MRVSVVIPCYNCGNTIRQCIQSVFNQTQPVDEIICIDDGSSDDTLFILKDLKLSSPQSISFKIIVQKNSGPSSARNKGIQVASYDWIAFLDSDDYWLDNKIEKDLLFISTQSDLVLLGSAFLKNNNSNEISFSSLLFKNYFITSSVLVDRRYLISKKLSFDVDKKYSEDYLLWLMLTLNGKAFLKSPKTTFSIDSLKEKDGFFIGEGLSSNLLKMEKGELDNFLFLYKGKYITFITFLIVSFFSILKFFLRLILKFIHNIRCCRL